MASSSPSGFPWRMLGPFPRTENLRTQILEAYDGDETKLAEDCARIGKLRGPGGLSVLHTSAQQGLAYTVKYLIENAGFDVNLETDKGSNALHFAVQHDEVDIVEYLIEKGANIHKLDKAGLTPLHMSAWKGSKNSIMMLISKGAHVESDAYSFVGTPLHSAINTTREADHRDLREGDTVRVLLASGANPNAALEGVLTPLHFAIMVDSLEIVKLLIEAGADVNTCVCGVSPLGHAAAIGRTEIVKYLLEAGADPDHVDVCGFTPFENAVFCGRFDSVEILFPATSPLSSFADWNLSSVLRQLSSEIFRAQRERMIEKVVRMTKSGGDNAFRRKEYWHAMCWYSQASNACPSDASVCSNKSLCCLLSNESEGALIYAKKCVRLRPDWPKAHYREGAAWTMKKNYPEAIEAFRRALKLDPNNKQIQRELMSCIREERNQGDENSSVMFFA